MSNNRDFVYIASSSFVNLRQSFLLARQFAKNGRGDFVQLIALRKNTCSGGIMTRVAENAS